MSELIDILKEYNPIIVVIIIIATYEAIKWIVEQVSTIKNWFEDKMKTYHSQENEKEKKENTINNRLIRLEEFQSNDHARLKGFGLQIQEICETNEKQNELLTKLDSSVCDLRIQSIRKQILDFYPIAIDLSSRPSREAYNECIRNHETYTALLSLKHEANGYIDYTYSKILDSMDQREKYKLFAENFVIQPTKDMLPKETEIIEGFDEEE